MIKIQNNMVAIEGGTKVVMADLSTIIHVLRYEVFPNVSDEPEEMIKKCVELGLTSDEDVAKEVAKKQKGISKKLDLLKQLINAFENEDEESDD